jgi:hypothetical protein
MAEPVLRVVVRPPVDRLVANLSAASWVKAVSEVGPEEFRIEVVNLDAAELHLPEVLAASGARLVEAGRAEGSLQDIFFRLTETGPYRLQAAGVR